ncbi:MAG: hypothetical protein BV459_00275 [Thermoplasmata archaeon M11B2D]|nr:MAG: hypothetical protein BV459_00275 [Thermoplasmata archaeon M11B2D]
MFYISYNQTTGKIEGILPKSATKNGIKPKKPFVVVDSDFAAEIKSDIQSYLVVSGAVVYVPVVQSLESIKARKKAEINSMADNIMNSILLQYPRSEVFSWDKQEAEAIAWQSDNLASTPLIDQISTERNIDKTLLITKILEKALMFKQFSGCIFGQRQKLEDLVDAAATVAEVDAISVVIIPPAP